MTSNKEQIIRYLREHKTEFRERFGIEKIGLFGSVVRGELQAQSDIDIAIEMLAEKKNLHNFLAFKRHLEHEFARSVDLGIESTLKPAVRTQVAREIVYV